MTRVKVTYVAMDNDGNRPIVTADSYDNLKKGLDEYYAIDNEYNEAECLGFTIYNTKYPDQYEGYYQYKWYMTVNGEKEEYIDKIKVYCIDFYPHTIYEVDDNQK